MKNCNVHHLNYQAEFEDRAILDAALMLSKKARHDNSLIEIAEFIYKHTKTKYVVIGSLSDHETHVHTIVFMEDGKLLENFTYSLHGTPCLEAVSQKFCYYPFGLTDCFPEDEDLKTLGVESYLGAILLSEKDEQIGLTALMDTKQISNPAFAEYLIKVLSPAIEEELKTLKI